MANNIEFAAGCDSYESCGISMFHGVVLFLGVFLKDGPPLRDSKILFEVLWWVFFPVGPGPKISESVDDDRDEGGYNKELYSDLKYHSNGFHW